MCPLCVASLYVAGGVSAGALTTFVVGKLLRDPEPTDSTISKESEGDPHDRAHDRNA